MLLLMTCWNIDSRDARVGLRQPLYMFIFRVLLGHTYICQQPRQFKRPPCTDSSCLSDTCGIHPQYDSVIGTHNTIGGAPVQGFVMNNYVSIWFMICKNSIGSLFVPVENHTWTLSPFENRCFHLQSTCRVNINFRSRNLQSYRFGCDSLF